MSKSNMNMPEMADSKPQEEVQVNTPVSETALAPVQSPQVTPVTQEQPVTKPSAKNERFHKLTTMLGAPLNKAANLVGAEGWWPTTMERECDKAARILYSFTKLETPTPPKTSGPKHPTGISRSSLYKIPPEVLRNCAGLAIFTTLRASSGQGSLACGSGLVVARRADRTWSPPSAFVVSTLGAGISFGLDMYECICVLNTPDQVEAFTRPRLSLGGEAAIAVGPLGSGTSVEAALSKTAQPVWSYMKSRGFWFGIQVDGTVVVSRGDANAVFYGERGITATKILQGDVAWPMGGKALFEVLKAVDSPAGTLPPQISADLPPTYDASVSGSPMLPPGFAESGGTGDGKGLGLGLAEGGTERREETILDEKQRLAASGF